MLCLFLTSCATQQEVPPAITPPQLRAVVANYDSGGAIIQCVLESEEPVDHVWQSVHVTEKESGKILAHSVLQKTENMLMAKLKWQSTICSQEERRTHKQRQESIFPQLRCTLLM